jgi:hypothetical protein
LIEDRIMPWEMERFTPAELNRVADWLERRQKAREKALRRRVGPQT